ncbi:MULTISPECIES: DUF349 domain-containing protein [Flavobacterium]|uniref:DUF349 domain-containing protein n=3 Tax=Flavobacterium TaxID=237 RepID=A0AA94F4M1_9FLAO|nr:MULTISPECIES: DUF349 domain-containing protein [Flavobacterium]OXA82965.1 chromosome segregation protein [Flavobacterium columnare NBRC 100251 = ATCC 23463]AMA48838.1 chromosome segregation protein [Flavobacterium covae]AND65029.1 chromosome segregation protein [Flavobacterium covae]MCH4830802.1 DUF349 domain-containing protein [Flavobacterium columnare]MCH4833260.1 DUF349 domain-containing protein [Flavobacterium columnare]
MQEEMNDNLLKADGNDQNLSQSDTQLAIETIENLNAEVNEDNTLEHEHEIPMKDYHTMSMDSLVLEFEQLLALDKIMVIRNHIEEIKSAFLSKYNHFIEEKKEEFLHENPNEDFEYHSPTKSKFDFLYNEYKNKRNVYFKNLEAKLKLNLQNRLNLIEELKTLLTSNAEIKDLLKPFNDIRDRWKSAGAIPKDKYNHVWNNYHFHVENFYDLLHLDREARDLEFKHNLDKKLKIIERAKNLLNELDVFKAFRELQLLHKVWKEEIGPVSKENREEIWHAFSEVTKQMHEKRENLFEQQRLKEEENLATKKDIINQIYKIAEEKITAHSSWQGQINKIETLRKAFFEAGKVPSEINEEVWADFKNAVRSFNANKNSFYKDIKKEQQANLDKKNALVARAKELMNNDNFNETTPIMKKIQEDWKLIGHVPKKFSDHVWGEFKEACNHYFDRLTAFRNQNEAIEIIAFDKKKDYLEIVKTLTLSGDHRKDLDLIKTHIETWKSFGKVPFSRRHIEGKFNKVLDTLFENLTSSKREAEMVRFNSRLEQLSQEGQHKIDGEKIFIQRKIEEVQNEIFQLENNIQFFSNAKKDNPMIIEVKKSIERNREELTMWKDKLKQIYNI